MKNRILKMVTITGILFGVACMSAYGQERDFYDRCIAGQSRGLSSRFGQRYRLDSIGCRQVEKTFIAYYSAIRALRGDLGSRAQKAALYREIENRRDSALREILPANQWKKYEALGARLAEEKRDTLQQR